MLRSESILVLLAVLALLLPAVVAQSLLSGDIAGTVTDPSGAVVPSAKVDLKSLDTGATQSTTSNSDGGYHFSLLKPGRYSVKASQTGFQTTEQTVQVAVGQTSQANIALSVGQTTQTIEVAEAASLLNPDPSNNTSFTPMEVALLPTAGGDITSLAFSAPGVVVNNTGGYGNFTMNGLPATSNLFTVNGENDMDPYFNINNSGATNLTIGANEMQEVTVIANPYAGQYGQLSGAQVIYSTKSGTNQFHGNAQYWWNGRDMDSNDWFNNATGVGRPFSNANQWAASLGGPIIKNKLFFFLDQEGLRFVIPNVDSETIPTQAFANAVLTNIATKAPNELTEYKTMFNLWATAPGSGSAQPLPVTPNSPCYPLTLPGFNGTTTPCDAKFQATPTALASEWILAARVDYKLSDKDNAFYRYRLDHGTQPTTLDAINSNFDAISNQPAWDNQFQETHIFGPRATNQFITSFSHYVAQFAQDPAEVASTFPYQVTTSGTVPFSSFNSQGSFPQGRNITQYQFIDDYTVVLGKHTLKFGANFRRYDVSDHNFFFNNPAVYFGYTPNGLDNFVNGLGYQYRKSLNFASDVPVALWGIGLYASDDWNIKPGLKITLALRAEHGSNPVCQFNCFANLKGPADTLASFTSSNPASVPYSADISTGLHQAFPGVDALNLAPRVGFSWSPFKDNKTVISGGFGVFYDNPASQLVDDELSNPPVAVAIRVRPPAGVPVFDPGPTGGAAIWAASAAAFNLNETFSQLSTALSKLGSVFAAPSVTGIVGTIHSPRVYEWNFQVQRQFTQSVALTVNYVGNHGERLLYTNPWPDAYDEYGIYNSKYIPETQPVPNYLSVTTVQNGGITNYDGLQVSVRKQFSKGFTAHFNYTWSHTLDDVSNGGLATYGDSILGQLSPLGLNVLNYGNADYDIRHQFSADWVYSPNFHLGNKLLNEVVSGWQWSGKINLRSGLPFSVTDNNTAIGGGPTTELATQIGPNPQSSCGEGANYVSGGTCLNANAFLNSNLASFVAYNGLSAQNRNQFRGPGYFDVDMALYRTFHITERMTLAVGLQAFNVFNHPNFANPDSGYGDPTFGQITSMVSSPTSPYGAFLNFDSSVRVAQLTGKIVF
jgi:hypothetical protein